MRSGLSFVAVCVVLALCLSVVRGQADPGYTDGQITPNPLPGTLWDDYQASGSPVGPAGTTWPTTIFAYDDGTRIIGFQVVYNNTGVPKTGPLHGNSGGTQTICDIPFGRNISTTTVWFASPNIYHIQLGYVGGSVLTCDLGPAEIGTEQSSKVTNGLVGFFRGSVSSTNPGGVLQGIVPEFYTIGGKLLGVEGESLE